MHYSQRLKNEVITEKAKLEAARQAVIDLRVHLLSPKFHVDTTIQVDDVQRWLDNVVAAINGEEL